MLKTDCETKDVPSFLGFDLPIYEGEFSNQTIVGSQPIKWIDFRPEVEKIFSPDNQSFI